MFNPLYCKIISANLKFKASSCSTDSEVEGFPVGVFAKIGKPNLWYNISCNWLGEFKLKFSPARS